MSLADDFLSAATGKSFDYAGIFLPPGYLWENGAAVSRVTFKRLYNVLTLPVTGTVTSGSNVISAVGFNLTTLDHSPAGWPLSGPGIPAGATVASVASNSITMSANATATSAGAAVVLAPYGVGDGVTTFNVPDACGRVIAGRDNMGGAAKGRMTAAGGALGTQLGKAAGTETHTLTATQMPSHVHGLAAVQTGGSATAGGSQISFANGNTTSAGGDAAHPNVQPTIVMHKIIKT